VNLLPLLVAVIVLAFLTGSDSLFYLAYVLIGVWLLTAIWMRQALADLRLERRFPERAFHGEVVQARLVVRNQGRWPVLWLKLHESLPLELHVPNFEQCVVSLAPKERAALEYQLKCQRRGYYMLGPLSLQTGDYFDLTPRREATWLAQPFIVYPRVVPLVWRRACPRSFRLAIWPASGASLKTLAVSLACATISRATACGKSTGRAAPARINFRSSDFNRPSHSTPSSS
jgi:uncharacterized protein (DUF58 family)